MMAAVHVLTAPLHGELTTVRSASASDVDRLVRWHADPEVARFWDDETFTVAEIRVRLARPDVDAYIIERGGAPVGYLQVWFEARRPGEAGLDMFLIPAARGAGLGPDAARAVARWLLTTGGQRRLTVDPYRSNEVAIRAWEKARFRREQEREADDDHRAPWLLMALDRVPEPDERGTSVLADVLRDAGLPRPQSARELRGGANSQVFEVVVPGYPVIVAKLYPDDLAWKREKEVYVYGLLADRPGVPVPTVMGSGVLDDARSTSYLLLTKLEGVLAAEIMVGLAPIAVEAIYAELGSIMRAIHAVTFDAFGYVTTTVLDPHPTNDRYMRFQFAKKLHEFDELGGPAPIRGRIERHVDALDGTFSRCAGAVLCHDDLHEGNVLLVQRDGAQHVSGILDVENVVAGDPILDLAKTVYYAARDDAGKRRGLLAGYGDLPTGWEEALDVYVLYHALELWDWFALQGDAEPAASVLRDLERLTT
jgi:hygromycin-B 7''-O-kinase